MNEDKELANEIAAMKQPWWVRSVLGIVSRDGIERLIALVFIAAVVYGGSRLLSLAEYVGSRQVFYIDSQNDISKQNAASLKTIAESGPRVEAQLEALRFEALKEHRTRSEEHKMLQDDMRRIKP